MGSTAGQKPCSQFSVSQDAERIRCHQDLCAKETTQQKMSNCLVSQCEGVASCLTDMCTWSALTDQTDCKAGTVHCSAYSAGEQGKYDCLVSQCTQTDQSRKSTCLIDQCAADATDTNCLTKVCAGLAEPFKANCIAKKRDCVTGYKPGESNTKCYQDACSNEAKDSDKLANCLVDSCGTGTGAATCRTDACPTRLAAKAQGDPDGPRENCVAGITNCAVYSTDAEKYACYTKSCVGTDAQKSNCLVDKCGTGASATACRTSVCAGLTDPTKCLKGEKDCSAEGIGTKATACIQTSGQAKCATLTTQSNQLANCLIDQCLGDPMQDCLTDAAHGMCLGTNARLTAKAQGDPDGPLENCKAGKGTCDSTTYPDAAERYKCKQNSCVGEQTGTEKSNCMVKQCSTEPTADAEACRKTVCSVLSTSDQTRCLRGSMTCSSITGDNDRFDCKATSCAHFTSDAEHLNCLVDQCRSEPASVTDPANVIKTDGKRGSCFTRVCNTGPRDHANANFQPLKDHCDAKTKVCSTLATKADRFTCVVHNCQLENLNSNTQVSDCVINTCKDLDAGEQGACLADVCARGGANKELIHLTNNANCLIGTVR